MVTSDDVGTGLLSAVRVRIPSASSEPQRRPPPGSTICSCCTSVVVVARKNHLGEDLELEHDQLLQIRLRRDLGARKEQVSTEPDSGGRDAPDLQAVHKGVSDGNRDKTSDWGHLGRDQVVVATCAVR